MEVRSPVCESQQQAVFADMQEDSPERYDSPRARRAQSIEQVPLELVGVARRVRRRITTSWAAPMFRLLSIQSALAAVP